MKRPTTLGTDADPIPPGARWLILTQYYPPEIGAPQIRLRAMAAELTRRGFAIDVLTGMPNYPAGVIQPGYRHRWRAKESIDGVTVRRTWLYPAAGRSARARLANYLTFTITASLEALSGPKPAVMFVESQPLSLGLCAVLMKWLRGVPYIYNVPDLQIDVARELGFMQNRRVLRVAQWLDDLFLRQSWKVSSVTEGFLEHFEARGIDRAKLTFLPNGADTAFLRPTAPSGIHRERWATDGRKVFIYVGTHAYYHGLDTLIDAAALVADEPEILVVIVGDGPERPRLETLVRARGLRNVVFGRNTYEELPALYSIAYASVATLRDVPVARRMRLAKIFPSLSCGVPVIYAGPGEAAELIGASGAGVVVAPESPQALATAIRELSRRPEMRRQMGIAGRTLVERDYSWSTIVGRWLEELRGRGRADTPVWKREPVQTGVASGGSV